MKFGYLDLPLHEGARSRPRPILYVRVAGPRRGILLPMLVDSGADETLIPASIARALEIRPGPEVAPLSSFSGEQLLAAVARVRLSFGGTAFGFESRLLFHEQVHVACLGHRDFFNLHRVTFDASRAVFEIEAAKMVH